MANTAAGASGPSTIVVDSDGNLIVLRTYLILVGYVLLYCARSAPCLSKVLF